MVLGFWSLEFIASQQNRTQISHLIFDSMKTFQQKQLKYIYNKNNKWIIRKWGIFDSKNLFHKFMFEMRCSLIKMQKLCRFFFLLASLRVNSNFPLFEKWSSVVHTHARTSTEYIFFMLNLLNYTEKVSFVNT